MRNLLAICLLTCFVALPTLSDAQYLRLTHLNSKTDVSIDANRLYNYNIYERNRWGLGFFLSTPLHYDDRYGYLFQNQFQASVYAGWGSGDHAWKYGASAALAFPRYKFRSINVHYQHDLLRVGSHSFDEYQILNTSDNSSYFSSHYCGVDRVAAVMGIDPSGPSELLLEYSHSRERYLFDASGLLYPNIYNGDTMPYETFNEVGVDLYWGKYWKFGVFADVWRHYDQTLDRYDPPGIRYIRFLSQYSRKKDLKDNHGQLSIFAQGGFVLLDDVPVSRRFDLSGTGGGYYYFNNSFLTVRPNTFMADAFSMAFVRYTTGRSLWKNALSEPHPFFQLGAVWGMLYGKFVENGTGVYYLGGTQPHKSIALTAPFKGLMEPCIGIDKLVHWGLIDFGVATAYQITPRNVSYHTDNFFDKFAVICVAKLVFE